MAKCGVVNFSTLMTTGRWDAAFLIRLSELIRARGIDSKDEKKVIALYKELDQRNEIPKGSNPKPVPKHIECPSCMSWVVDAVETTVVHTIDGKKTTTYSASLDCRNCHLHWVLESGSNEQIQ